MPRRLCFVLLTSAVVVGSLWALAGCGSTTTTTTTAPETTVAPATATITSSTPATTATISGALSGEPIVIGGALALSGPVSPYDLPPLAFAELAVEDLNAAGGVLGRPLQVVTADTKSDPAQGPTAALEVLDKKAVAVIVTSDFDFGSPAALTAQSKGVIAFSPGAASPKFGVQGIGPLAYTMSTGTPGEGFTIAEWAKKDKGWESAYALLDDGSEYERTTMQYFKTRWAELGGALAGEDKFLNADPSIASQITKMKSAPKFDFIVISTHTPGGASAIRQIRAAGITAPIIGPSSMDGAYWLDAVPNLSDFYVLAYGSIYGDDPDPKFNEMLARYEEKTGQKVANGIAFTGYSVIQALAKAINTAGSTDGAAVATVIDQFKDEPFLVGPTTYTPDLHINVMRPWRIVQIQNGKPSYLATFQITEAPKVTF
ncbi:MAG: ABC transporter substrate-binding protein [Thermoleophilia bacterium]|nr:ABC transporter substrate-binding protein [Thermoleophilia bacterium]